MYKMNKCIKYKLKETDSLILFTCAALSRQSMSIMVVSKLNASRQTGLTDEAAA